MNSIFISYKREDRPSAQRLADTLSTHGFEVWWDMRLQAGEYFDDEIERAIQESLCAIVLWSGGSVSSRFVKDEATFALGLGKLIPIAIESVDLPFRFRNLHTIRLDPSEFGEGRSQAWNDLVGVIKKLAETGPSAAVTAKSENSIRGKPETHPTQFALEGHRDAVRRVVFARGGSQLLSASSDHTARLWSVADRRVLAVHSTPTDAYRLAATDDGERVFLQTLDPAGRIPGMTVALAVGTASFRELWRLDTECHELAISSDGALLALSLPDQSEGEYLNSIALLDPSNGRLLRKFAAHRQAAQALAFSANGRWLASGSHDQTVRVWRPSDGQLIHHFGGYTDPILGVGFSPDASLLAAASTDGSLRLWKVEDGREAGVLCMPGDNLRCVAFAPNGLEVAAGTYEGHIRIWSVLDHELIETLRGHSDSVNGLAYSPDGHRLASASSDHSARVWNR